VVPEKDGEGKNKLKITAEGIQYLRRQWWYKMVVASSDWLG
jgi:hypothetical protein